MQLALDFFLVCEFAHLEFLTLNYPWQGVPIVVQWKQI